MAQKKTSLVHLKCPVCKRLNYTTTLNKTITKKLVRKKFCSHCRKKTEHTSTDIKS